MTSEEFKEFIKESRKELLDEEFKKRPTVYTLEQVGNKLLDLVKKLRSEDKFLDTTLISLKMDLDIFLADLTGALQHDYEKENKRYKGKWSNEKIKLNGFIVRIKKMLSEKEMD